MAYVRQKGNQVVIVHGQRNPVTNSVEQQTLFVFYSKAETKAATGKSKQMFRQFLKDEFPEIRFDWKKLDAAITDNMAILPDLYPYKQGRVENGFRNAMVAFTKELLIADPQVLISSARLLKNQQHELMYLRDLINWRLDLADQEENEWNQDNPFFWRTLMQRRQIPVEGMEAIAQMYENQEYDKVEALARLFVECWDNYAEGHNYLGLAAMAKNDLTAAETHFKNAMTTGRTLFPKRIQKDSYWSDVSTRPYIRSIIYLAQTCNRKNEYTRTLALCDKLDKECGQKITAMSERIPVYLNSGAWEEAEKAARYVCEVYPQENFTRAFALCEMDLPKKALAPFISAIIKFPRTAGLLGGVVQTQKPKSADEVTDHNTGVESMRSLEVYLHNKKHTGKKMLTLLLENSEVKALVKEAVTVRQSWRNDRSGDRKWFNRLLEMESRVFAEKTADRIWPLLEAFNTAAGKQIVP